MVSINTIAGTSGAQQQNIRKTNERLQDAISSLVSGKRVNDVADVAVASQLQSEVAGLRQVSNSLSQASSLTQVADGALEETQRIVDRLREIAIQSQNGATSDTDRAALDEEFQELVEELDRQVATTQFNGKNLLDGTLSGENGLSLNGLLGSKEPTEQVSSEELPAEQAEGFEGRLVFEDLSTEVLFDGEALDVFSVEGAEEALAALSTASSRISEARAATGSFQQTLDFAAATIDSAIVNQEAARSLLSDADFLEAANDSQQAQVQRNAQLSLLAQGNRLPPKLLDLIN